MSRELSRLYRTLAADTDERALPAPDQLRRGADRRARNRAALGALAAVLVVAGATGTAVALASGPDASPGPPPAVGPSAPAVTGAPSPAPSPSAAGPSSGTPGAPASTGPRPTATSPTSIPDRAFFALPAANEAGGGPRFVSGPVLPAFCGTTPGGESILARRGRILPFKLSGGADVVVPDGLYRHSVTSYRPGRADDALRELRQAVRDCPRQDGPNEAGEIEQQRLLAGGGYGDESVLVEIRAPHPSGYGGDTGEDETHLLRAIRVGDVVTVLWERGWEGTSTDVAQFDADSRRATEAVRRWLEG